MLIKTRHIIVILIFMLSVSCVPYTRTSNIYVKDMKQIDIICMQRMLFVNVTLNDKTCLLLIDTGASRSLLNINKCNKYGFGYIKSEKINYIGIGGVQDIYVIYDYKIDDFFISMLGADLEDVTRYFNEDNIDIIGIMGSDFLNDNNAIIDYQNLKLYVKR